MALGAAGSVLLTLAGPRLAGGPGWWFDPGFGAGRDGNKVVLTFDHVGGGLKPFDVHEPRGFTIASSDRKFVRADARLVGKDKIEVWSDQVSDPVSVRYAWADNPVCNLYSSDGLPVTPFRTDDWPGVTAEKR